ncbi:MAG: hypothetical protein KAU17_13900, partial [Spirochaetales bacterium]|nr:hypothetical protein [Spirochaetales bacterium]
MATQRLERGLSYSAPGAMVLLQLDFQNLTPFFLCDLCGKNSYSYKTRSHIESRKPFALSYLLESLH